MSPCSQPRCILILPTSLWQSCAVHRHCASFCDDQLNTVFSGFQDSTSQYQQYLYDCKPNPQNFFESHEWMTDNRSDTHSCGAR
ncbi:hypothetical protein BJV78DRAFT_1251122 [Lactifluus subvellereus]|nr:hypothetical protein BJV78DRAFT_1251122 [Lactifluus subvellereus]